jgi:hypothetical protein
MSVGKRVGDELFRDQEMWIKCPGSLTKEIKLLASIWRTKSSHKSPVTGSLLVGIAV